MIHISESLPIDGNAWGWWIWHGALYDHDLNTWVWARSGEPVEFTNWISTATASSMPGAGYWTHDEPNGLEFGEDCTFLNPTHHAGLINDVCAQQRRVLCEYE